MARLNQPTRADRPDGSGNRLNRELRVERANVQLSGVNWFQVPDMESMPANEFVEVRNGGYYVAGTRIGLDVVYYSLQRGRSAEATFEAFPLTGSLSKVRGAIAFIKAHPQEIQAYLEEQERRYEEFTRRHPLPAELIERFEHGRRELLENHS